MEKIVDFSKLSIKKIRELIVFTALIVVALWKFDVVLGVIKAVWGIIFPFALGGAIAFVINVPMSFLEKKLFGKAKEKGSKAAGKLARPISLLLTIVLVVGVIVLVMFGLIPQLTATIGSLMNSIAEFIPQMQSWVREFTHNNREIMDLVNQVEFNPNKAIQWGDEYSRKWCGKFYEYNDDSGWLHRQWSYYIFYCLFLCLLYSFPERKTACAGEKSVFRVYSKTKSRSDS